MLALFARLRVVSGQYVSIRLEKHDLACRHTHRYLELPKVTVPVMNASRVRENTEKLFCT